MAEGYELYEPADVRAVLEACGDTPTGLRDGAFIFLVWCTGLRCSEALSLTPEDVDRRRGAVWVACGKGGKSRTVVTPKDSRPELWRMLDRWMKQRESFAWTGSPLFCNLRGERLSTHYVRKAFIGLADAAGLRRRFHPHGLRHTFAASMHLAGVPLDTIMKQLGHADLGITGAYLKRIGSDVVHATMADFSLE